MSGGRPRGIMWRCGRETSDLVRGGGGVVPFWVGLTIYIYHISPVWVGELCECVHSSPTHTRSTRTRSIDRTAGARAAAGGATLHTQQTDTTPVLTQKFSLRHARNCIRFIMLRAQLLLDLPGRPLPPSKNLARPASWAPHPRASCPSRACPAAWAHPLRPRAPCAPAGGPT